MKAILTTVSVLAALAVSSGSALAHEDRAEGGSTHWIQHLSTGNPTERQLAPYGYEVTGAPARVVTLGKDTPYLNVTRLETVQINIGGKSVTWMFDTLGTTPFPLSKIISGADGITVYVAENPANRGG